MTTIDGFRNSVSAADAAGRCRPCAAGAVVAAQGRLERGPQVRARATRAQADCDWVHAHLHRQEGDLSNAGYWYRHAGKPVATCTLQEEWEQVTDGVADDLTFFLLLMLLSPARGRGGERGLRTSPATPSPSLSPERGRGT